MISQTQQYTVSQSQGGIARPVCAAVWSFDPGSNRVLVEEKSI